LLKKITPNPLSESYFSSTTLKEADNTTLLPSEQSPDYLTTLSHPSTPPHHLRLKKNAICAIQRNISIEKGLVRNARVQITALHRRFVEVRLLQSNQTHCIPRISFDFNPPASDWTVQRRQFPLRLAYATTFNGCQGLTLAKTALDLRIDPFAHGQLYTALSRVRSRHDSLAIFSTTNENEDTANVVLSSLLL